MARWVEERFSGAPESLLARVLEALGDGGSGKGEAAAGILLSPSPFPFSGHLRSVAERLLAEAQLAPASRDSALTLLAADALITLAVEAEAASDIGPTASVS